MAVRKRTCRGRCGIESFDGNQVGAGAVAEGKQTGDDRLVDDAAVLEMAVEDGAGAAVALAAAFLDAGQAEGAAQQVEGHSTGMDLQIDGIVIDQQLHGGPILRIPKPPAVTGRCSTVKQSTGAVTTEVMTAPDGLANTYFISTMRLVAENPALRIA